LGWFAKIIRGTLIGYLDSLPNTVSPTDEKLFSKLAFEKAGLKIKLKKDVKKGQVLMSGDIEYR
jgi:hypothetical protein